jgi:hypothetical protein
MVKQCFLAVSEAGSSPAPLIQQRCPSSVNTIKGIFEFNASITISWCKQDSLGYPQSCALTAGVFLKCMFYSIIP